MRLTRALAVSLMALGLLVYSIPARAQDYNVSQYINGPWLMFSFDSAGMPVQGCQPADPNGAACTLPTDVNAVAAPAFRHVEPDGYVWYGWWFEAGPDGVTMTVTDVGTLGDTFEVYEWFDPNNPMPPVGVTTDAAGGDCGTSPIACISAGASHGSFFFGQGWHMVTIVTKDAPSGAGTGFVRFDGDTRGAYWDSDGDGMADSWDMCPGSDISPTIVIGTCDSGVANLLWGDGCMVADVLKKCAAEPDYGNRMKCTMAFFNNAGMKGHGLSTVYGLPGNQGNITSCIAKY